MHRLLGLVHKQNSLVFVKALNCNELVPGGIKGAVKTSFA
jgi:hypothetical protein